MDTTQHIVIHNFNGPGVHLFESQLGWQLNHKREARSAVSKEIFRHYIVDLGYNLTFYHVDTDSFYGLHTEWVPVAFKVLPRDLSTPYIAWQCNCDTHQEGKVLCEFQEADMRIWDKLQIGGTSLEEALERSVIMLLG